MDIHIVITIPIASIIIDIIFFVLGIVGFISIIVLFIIIIINENSNCATINIDIIRIILINTFASILLHIFNVVITILIIVILRINHSGRVV
jgi:uncharacterized membrane protein